MDQKQMRLGRKALMRRVGLFVGVVVLSITAALLSFQSNIVSRKASRRQNHVAENASATTTLLLRMQSECDMALGSFDDTDWDSFFAEVSEYGHEAVDEARKLELILTALQMSDVSNDLGGDVRELKVRLDRIGSADGVSRAEVAVLLQDVLTLQNTVLHANAQVNGKLAQEMESSLFLDRLAWVCLAATAILGLTGVLLVASDTVNQVMEPFDLNEELRRVQGSSQFGVRMEKLVRQRHGHAPPQGEWVVKLDAEIHVSRTHTTFRATAQNGECTVPLWGKCYTWAGMAKRIQRIVEPAFSAGTWRCLCMMCNHKVSSPMPVAYRKIKRNGVTAGALVLAEDVGDVSQFKEFVRTNFVLLDTAARAAFLQELVSFWLKLHSIGLHSLSCRYVHLRADDGGGATQFFLFDLDKVGLSGSVGGWWHRFCEWRDDRRLLRFLRLHLSEDEYRFCENRLVAGRKAESGEAIPSEEG